MGNAVKNKLFVVISSLAFFALCLTRDLRWDVLLGLCFVCVIISTVIHDYKISSDIFNNKFAVILAFILSTTAFISFYYQMTEEYGIPRRVLASHGLDVETISAAVGIIIFFISLLSTILFCNWLITAAKPMRIAVSRMKKELLFLFIVYLVSLIAIVRADFYYIDDVGRALQGYQLTGSFSRYIATFMSNFLHAGSWLTDISPLTQIIAVLILSVAGVLLLYTFNNGEKLNRSAAIALIPMGISPYFISCLSYKYDSPYMAASVLFSVIPLLYRDKKPFRYMLSVFFCTLLMCMTYQASSGIFPMTVVFLSLFMWLKRERIKTILIFCAYSAAGYITGLLFFKFALASEVVATEGYVNTGYSVLNIFYNLSEYTATVISDFGALWLTVISVIIVFFVVSVYMRSKKPASIWVAISVLVVSFILSFGAYLILDFPLLAPRAMYCVGVWITLISIPVMCCEKLYVGKSFVIIISWIFIVFSFTYGNALNVQKQYTNFRTEQIAEDLRELDMINTDAEVIVQIDGNIGFAHNVENMIKKYPILQRSVPIMLKGDYNYWGHFSLIHYYGFDNLIWNSQENGIDLNDMDLPVVTDNAYHTIKANDRYIEINLK